MEMNVGLSICCIHPGFVWHFPFANCKKKKRQRFEFYYSNETKVIRIDANIFPWISTVIGGNVGICIPREIMESNEREREATFTFPTGNDAESTLYGRDQYWIETRAVPILFSIPSRGLYITFDARISKNSSLSTVIQDGLTWSGRTAEKQIDYKCRQQIQRPCNNNNEQMP